MSALPDGFEARDRETIPGEAAPTPLPRLDKRDDLNMPRRTLWAVCSLDCSALGSTAAVFDALWQLLRVVSGKPRVKLGGGR